MTRQSLIPAVFVIVRAAAGLPAAAQSTDADNGAPVELTPYVSLGSYPSPRVGAAVTFPLMKNLSVESEVGYRHDSIMGALSLSASLLYNLPRIGRVIPYLAAGAGLEQYATAFQLPGGALAAQQRTAFAINAGGGLKVSVNDNWGIRTDARWFNGLGRDAGEHWRVYDGVTFRTGRR
jgi:opacity protein-like surface antigen